MLVKNPGCLYVTINAGSFKITYRLIINIYRVVIKYLKTTFKIIQRLFNLKRFLPLFAIALILIVFLSFLIISYHFLSFLTNFYGFSWFSNLLDANMLTSACFLLCSFLCLPCFSLFMCLINLYQVPRLFVLRNYR